VPVNRELWKESLTQEHTPHWHCPACAGGYLRQKPGSLHFSETQESHKNVVHEAWEPEWIVFRFSAIVICNNEHCREVVAITGTGTVDHVQTHEDGQSDYIEFFHPEYVSPSPLLIPIRIEYPQLVVSELRLSFTASWSDFSSAGNHIRAAVERLLDHLGEPATKADKGGKTLRVPLHERIEGLGKRDKGLSDRLLAVKWIGNAGSHKDELTRDDVFDALDIVDVILDDLFVRHREKVTALVAAINETKGPRKRED
jgi:hypothetical protein